LLAVYALKALRDQAYNFDARGIIRGLNGPTYMELDHSGERVRAPGVKFASFPDTH
jgi:hypothetical protein